MPKEKPLKRYSVIRSITLWQRTYILARSKREVEKMCRTDTWIDWQTFDEGQYDPIITSVREDK